MVSLPDAKTVHYYLIKNVHLHLVIYRLPLILTTDDEKKVKIYEHFGMKMVREHIVSDRAIYYEMLREGNKGYRKKQIKGRREQS